MNLGSYNIGLANLGDDNLGFGNAGSHNVGFAELRPATTWATTGSYSI